MTDKKSCGNYALFWSHCSYWDADYCKSHELYNWKPIYPPFEVCPNRSKCEMYQTECLNTNYKSCGHYNKMIDLPKYEDIFDITPIQFNNCEECTKDHVIKNYPKYCPQNKNECNALKPKLVDSPMFPRTESYNCPYYGKSTNVYELLEASKTIQCMHCQKVWEQHPKDNICHKCGHMFASDDHSAQFCEKCRCPNKTEDFDDAMKFKKLVPLNEVKKDLIEAPNPCCKICTGFKNIKDPYDGCDGCWDGKTGRFMKFEINPPTREGIDPLKNNICHKCGQMFDSDDHSLQLCPNCRCPKTIEDLDETIKFKKMIASDEAVRTDKDYKNDPEFMAQMDTKNCDKMCIPGHWLGSIAEDKKHFKNGKEIAKECLTCPFALKAIAGDEPTKNQYMVEYLQMGDQSYYTEYNIYDTPKEANYLWNECIKESKKEHPSFKPVDKYIIKKIPKDEPFGYSELD